MTCPAIKWKIWGLNPGSLALESTAKWKTYGTDPCLHTSMGPLTIPTPTIYTNSKASEYVMSLVSVCLWPNLASVRVSHWCWHPDIHIWKTKTMQGEENLKKKKTRLMCSEWPKRIAFTKQDQEAIKRNIQRTTTTKSS